MHWRKEKIEIFSDIGIKNVLIPEDISFIAGIRISDKPTYS